MKLYYSPAACSLAVHIALRELGQAPDLVKVDLATHRTEAGDDYLALNPHGYVPLLELDDGSRHTEGAALLQYLADAEPARGLLPAQGRERLEALKWLTFVSSELHKAFSPWLWHKETADSTRQAVKERIGKRFAELERHLAGRAFLLGDAFSVADAYAFTIVRWAPMLDMSLNPYPRLAAYLERVAARPAVRAALQAEGLVKA